MSPREFSEVVMPKEILLTKELIDVFKWFTSVPVPAGGLKFTSLPRAVLKQNTRFSSLDLGYSSLNKLPADIANMQKSGIMTFLVRKSIELCGVKIIMKPSHSYYPSLFVFQREKKIRQIKSKIVTRDRRKRQSNDDVCDVTHTSSVGIDVFFNRPIRLSENTCYTIKTQLIDHDSHRDSRTVFVWSKSLQNHLQKHPAAIQTILKCSGHYTECIRLMFPTRER